MLFCTRPPSRYAAVGSLRQQAPGDLPLNHLYSLYDALVSINVPTDKARAVIDAMERDMATAIATKSDLQLLRQELTSLLSAVGTRDELRATRDELRQDIAELRQDTALLRKDLEMLPTSMTVRLGSIMVVGLGIVFAALKLT
jgi:hypothetical protein